MIEGVGRTCGPTADGGLTAPQNGNGTRKQSLHKRLDTTIINETEERLFWSYWHNLIETSASGHTYVRYQVEELTTTDC